MSCVVCGKSSALMCQRCRESYCNDVCQRQDWQRHKYFCIVMPPLVSVTPLNLGATVSHATGGNNNSRPLEHASSKCSFESIIDLSINEEGGNNSLTEGSPVVAEKPVIKLSTEWRNHVNPPDNEFFNCRVSYKEKDGSFWVVEEANAERLEQLADDMARTMQNKKPCNIQNIAIGDLVSVAIDKKMYRAEIMDLKPNAKNEVRLIDYGAVANIDAEDIYLAVPRMAEFKAYAFKVKMSCQEGVEVNKLLSLCLLGSKNIDGIHQVQLKMKKTIPLDLPIQMLSTNPDVILAKTFKPNASLNEPQVALLQIKKPNHLNDQLNSTLSNKSGMKLTDPFPEKLRSFFLAALTNEGYRRAFLLDFIEQPSMFLVYEMDMGRISITSEVRRIPDELIDHPLHVFAVTLMDGKSTSFQQILSKCGRELAIKFHDEGTTAKLRTAEATLLANNKEVCEVRVDSFMGRIAELGLKFWQEPIENGSLVYITHVFNYHTICISSVQTKQYPEIFKSLLTKCLPFSPSSDIPTGTMVLVVCPNGRIYRGKVIADMENSRYGVRNIDTDTAHRVPPSYLRKSCAFLESLPVSKCRASINTICSIPPDVVPPNTTAIRLLTKLCEEKSELQVQFSDSECSALDLLDAKIEPPSLVARMLPLMFTPTAVYLKPAEDLPEAHVYLPEDIQVTEPSTLSITGLPQLPLSPPNTPNVVEKNTKQIKRHYFDDVKRDMLPLGAKVQILILNSIGLHKMGYLTACFFSSEKIAEDFQNFLNLVADIGNDDKILPGYQPEVGEMCLTLFSEDNSWYRGVCLKVRGHDAEILYCDFGNTEVVPMEKIKPIPTELLQTVYATKCFIDDFDKSKNFIILEKYLTVNNNLVCAVLEGSEPNTRLVKIPKLHKILSQELK
ncbi:hypothetical protein ACLKA7_011778 [Drosophila subpalustris]